MSWEAWGDPPEPPEMRDCENCNGQGWVKDHDRSGTSECDVCGGTGEVEVDPVHFDDDVI